MLTTDSSLIRPILARPTRQHFSWVVAGISRAALKITGAAGTIAILAVPASATTHLIEVGGALGNAFSPSNLTIEAGDSVTWRNLGGFHNVSANGFFRCAQGCDGEGGNGGPSSVGWEFTRTFNAEAVIDYVCEPHEGVGMTGRITVQPAASTTPGTVAFASASFAVDESVGAATIATRRTGGSDGAISVEVFTSDGSATAGADYTPTVGTLSWNDGDSTDKFIDVPIEDDSQAEADETINIALANPAGGASIGSPAASSIRIHDNDTGTADPGSLRFTQASYDARESDGSVALQVERIGGDQGAISVEFSAVGASASEPDDFAASTGSLDWADGDAGTRAIDVALVDDTELENTETFSVTLSAPGGGAELATPSVATVSIVDDDSNGCTPSLEVLCLGAGGRFEVTVDWRIRNGQTGVGKTIELGKTFSGLFYFFDENNAEMLVKVLDGCPVNGRHWVFFAATTDVELNLTVVDTQSGLSQTYSNPLGQPANAITDVDAFATCP